MIAYLWGPISFSVISRLFKSQSIMVASYEALIPRWSSARTLLILPLYRENVTDDRENDHTLLLYYPKNKQLNPSLHWWFFLMGCSYKCLPTLYVRIFCYRVPSWIFLTSWIFVNVQTVLSQGVISTSSHKGVFAHSEWKNRLLMLRSALNGVSRSRSPCSL